MRKSQTRLNSTTAGTVGAPRGAHTRGATAQLQRRLAELEAQLGFYRRKDEWLQSALAAQRHARQLLEAGVSANYGDTIGRIRQVARVVVPPGATVVVISKGDEELLQFEGCQGWHFPQTEQGIYAGHYPANSTEAISQLHALVAKGAQFLLFPNTAFWWLEHYRGLKEWLDGCHAPVWRDERCAIYKFRKNYSSPTGMTVRAADPDELELLGSRTGPVESGPQRVQQLEAPADGQYSDILCFPIIDWDFRFQRPQQLMRRFAAGGHRVFYLSHRFRKSGEDYSLRSLAPALWEVSLRGPNYNAYQGVLDEAYCESLSGALSNLCENGLSKATLAVVQSPFWWPVAREIASRFGWRLVYDCMDHHAGFSTSNAWLVEQERELFAQADLVLTSSALLQRQARRYARKVCLVRNGCDYEHFVNVQPKPRSQRPVIGYYGAIADWFDSDLVADLAERRADWDFLLVGSTFSADVSRLTRLRNVSLPGEKPYAELPDWLAKFDVAILPFKRTPLTEATNPVKAYEIFASGKPLVSVPLPEMIPLKPLARLASSVDEFEREIQAELHGIDETSSRKRRAFARRNTWEKRYQKLYSAMQHLLVPACQLAPPRRGYQDIPRILV